jgi:hypothetical protein
MKPLRGTVTDVLDGLQIKLENGWSVHWPAREGFELGAKLLIFYDFTKQRIKGITRAKDYPVIEEPKQPDTVEIEDPGNINHNFLFEEDERGTDADNNK